MSANLPDQLQATLDDLTRQHSAAVQRQHDLEQQLKAAQGELTRLGFMQLGKKMMLRAEADSIAKKLGANQHLQSTLQGRIAAVQAQLSEAQAAKASEPAAIAEPAAEDAPAPVAEPVAEPAIADVPALVAEPSLVAAPAPAPQAAPRKPRAAGPKQPVVRAARPEVSDDLPLPEQVSRLLAHLEDYYPEHQLFAAEVLTTQARTRLSELAARCGHASPAELLAAHGWQMITPAEGRALRQGRYTTPGGEPAVILPKLRSVLHRMEKHYPDHVIARSIQHDHKSLAQDVSALSAYLGYASSGELLTAYGFRYDVPTGGRPALDVDGIVAALKAAYAGGPRPRTIAQITADHPEYAAVLKTLQNQAPRRFGMSLRRYFTQQGLM